QNLTIPERVAFYNIEMLQALVNDGRANFLLRGENRFNLKTALLRKGTQILWGDIIIRNGIKHEICIGDNRSNYRKFELENGDIILKPNGDLIKAIPNQKKTFKIEIGDIVERWLTTGDYLLFNQKY
ncbi:MAG: hypothetical protein AABY22_34280, partial [Nanoarchaeota archaeon]